jgi:2-haloacid dehalogenase
MSGKHLQGIEACVFDAYGTLFDFASAAARLDDELQGKSEALNALWRQKQLQYTWLRTLQQHHADFWQVTGDALDFALDTLGIQDGRLHKKLMESYLALEPFPEVPGMLRQLKAAGLKTAILSNGSPHMLSSAVAGAGLDHLFDEILSVEEVRAYKPHPAVYQLAVDRIGVQADAISFQSSNSWDAYAASAFGMRVVWCNRYGQRPERMPGKPDLEVTSLSGLPSLLLGTA